MVPVKSIAITIFTAIAFFSLWTSSARAVVILDTNASGHLIGARNVSILGLGEFDVSFVDGTCIDVFSGCDNALLDFEFHNIFDAVDAAEALLEQVFIGTFDTEPGLTAGCIGASECSALVLYDFNSADTQFVSATARNLATVSDQRLTAAANKTDDLALSPTTVFAVFSPAQSSVPEPASLFLFAAGLAGFAGLRRRR